MNFVSTQFFAQIKIIKSNNALKFFRDLYKTFFIDHYFLRQNSCVERPQQIGRVARKHRHILKMARAQRFQANLLV